MEEYKYRYDNTMEEDDKSERYKDEEDNADDEDESEIEGEIGEGIKRKFRTLSMDDNLYRKKRML